MEFGTFLISARTHDQYHLDRPGNNEIQLDLFLSYGSNPPLYGEWQAYFRKHQPPTLIVWSKNDQVFPAAGAEPYKRDLKTLEYHLLDTGHFALEEEGARIAADARFPGQARPQIVGLSFSPRGWIPYWGGMISSVRNNLTGEPDVPEREPSTQ